LDIHQPWLAQKTSRPARAARKKQIAGALRRRSFHGGLFGLGHGLFPFEIGFPAVAFLNLIVL
jgi:hypothetical protein